MELELYGIGVVWNWSYMELEPTEIQNAKTSISFLKRGEYFKNEKFWLNISDVKVYFFRTESIHCTKIEVFH